MTHNTELKIAIAGGTGQIGKLIRTHIPAAALSPSTGVNAYTGEGLEAALDGVDVLIDVLNSPSFAPGVVQDFFTRTTTNLTKARVKHYVALSIVGVDRMAGSAYMQAKIAQERIIRESGIPYTIIRATQFFEFLKTIAAGSTNAEGKVVLANGAFQPIAAADVAATIAEYALKPAANQTLDLAGPDRTTLAGAISKVVPPESIVVDPQANYFGAECRNGELVPQGPAILGKLSLDAWLMLS